MRAGKDNNNDDKLIARPHHRYRIDIINDDTYEDVATIHITRFNIILFGIIFFIFVNVLIIAAIVFTPIRYYIPGYGGISNRKELMELKIQYDSLENSLRQHDTYFKVLKDVLGGSMAMDTSKYAHPKR